MITLDRIYVDDWCIYLKNVLHLLFMWHCKKKYVYKIKKPGIRLVLNI